MELEPLDGLAHRGEVLSQGGKQFVASGQRLALGGWGQPQAVVWVDRLRDALVPDGSAPVVPELVWRQRVWLAWVLQPLA